MSIKTTLARPYAKAAFELAVDHNNVPAWSTLLETAAWVVRQPKMQQFLRDPRSTSEVHYDRLVELCDSTIHEEGRNLFKILARNGRLFVLPEIAELFATYRIEREKIVNVVAISALPLTAIEQQHLSQALKIKLQRNVTLHCETDNTLIGGVVVRAGDLVIDSSVRSQLARLKTELTS